MMLGDLSLSPELLLGLELEITKLQRLQLQERWGWKRRDVGSTLLHQHHCLHTLPDRTTIAAGDLTLSSQLPLGLGFRKPQRL